MADLFSVVQFFQDDTWEYVLQDVEAATAVDRAKTCTVQPAALIGVVRRVIITDSGDFTNFEWKFGEGVVYPPKS